MNLSRRSRSRSVSLSACRWAPGVTNAELWTLPPCFLRFAVETRSIYTKLKHDEIPVNAADGPIVIYEDRRDSDVSTEPSSDEADEEDHVIEVDDMEKPSRENHKQVGQGKPHGVLLSLPAACKGIPRLVGFVSRTVRNDTAARRPPIAGSTFQAPKGRIRQARPPGYASSRATAGAQL